MKLSFGAYTLLNRAFTATICINDDRGEIDYLARYYFIKSLIYSKNGYVNNYRDIGIILGLDLAILEKLKKMDSNKNKLVLMNNILKLLIY